MIVFGGGKFVVEGDTFSMVVVGLVGQDPLPWRIVVAGDLPYLPMVAKQQGQNSAGQILVRRLWKM